MSETGVVQLAPIGPMQVDEVGAFLHAHLNRRLSAGQWAASMLPSWSVSSPNHGFLLRADGDVVGVQLAFYASRDIDGRIQDFCNLGAWCVLDEYRSHGVRLLRAALGQRGYHFTDLSPSGNVVALNERLGFQRLDTETVIVPHRPLALSRGLRVVSDEDEIEGLLDGRDLAVFRDHRGAAAVIHLVLAGRTEHCYVMVRRERRKDLPVFASLLHVGNRALLDDHLGLLGRHLLVHHRLVATLLQVTQVQRRPAVSYRLARPRPKMFRSARGSDLSPDGVDYLYSELALVAW